MSDEKKDMTENELFNSQEMVKQFYQMEYDKALCYAVLSIGLQIISKMKSESFDAMSVDVEEI